MGAGGCSNTKEDVSVTVVGRMSEASHNIRSAMLDRCTSSLCLLEWRKTLLPALHMMHFWEGLLYTLVIEYCLMSNAGHFAHVSHGMPIAASLSPDVAQECCCPPSELMPSHPPDTRQRVQSLWLLALPGQLLQL